MSWWLMLVHALNPLLLFIGMNEQRSGDDADGRPSLEQAFTVVLTAFFIYLFWLGGHYLALRVYGAGLDFPQFVGDGASSAYFVPFVIGGVMLLLRFFITPRLRTEKLLALVDTLYGLLLPIGCYFMFINYLAWLVK